MHKMMRDQKLKADDLLGDYQELLVNYFRIFGNKKCCANDLKMFIDYLEPGRRPELSSKLIQDTGISSTTLPQDVSCSLFNGSFLLNFHFQLSRKINSSDTFAHFKSQDCAELIRHCQRNIFKHFTQRWVFTTSTVSVRSTEIYCQPTSGFQINTLY